jgi:hypothetical protein
MMFDACFSSCACACAQVQLLLRSFAELKSDDGHARYVAFRNARGK